MSEIIIYDEAGMWPTRDNKELSKKVKDIILAQKKPFAKDLNTLTNRKD